MDYYSELNDLYNKICITSALGFDTFVVLRHGLRYDLHDPVKHGERLGCYFCGDIVVQINFIKVRKLYLQYYVSRRTLW